MDLNKLQETWNVLGQADPFWAILSYQDKAGNKWDVREFFKTGEIEIEGVMEYLDALGLSIERGRALDFGCGAGRLSQALCRHFRECDGVDIAPSMIELARQFNQSPDRCRYHLNAEHNLRLFADRTFDFIYCNIVLQHMEPEYSTAYIGEFIRLLDTTGIAVFQVPSELNLRDSRAPASSAVLPDSAFRARLRILDPPVRVAAGSRHLIRVRVRNLSDCSWPGFENAEGIYPVRVGTRWHREPDCLVIEESARADLLHPLPPGHETDVNVAVTAPRAGGIFRLEVDLVQESIAWFRDKGSFAVQTSVRVDAPPEPAADPQMLVPVIEMHGVPRDVVEQVVASHGAEIVDVREDKLAGAGWRSFRYCIRKPQ